jgi:hypothetical protein
MFSIGGFFLRWAAYAPAGVVTGDPYLRGKARDAARFLSAALQIPPHPPLAKGGRNAPLAKGGSESGFYHEGSESGFHEEGENPTFSKGKENSAFNKSGEDLSLTNARENNDFKRGDENSDLVERRKNSDINKEGMARPTPPSRPLSSEDRIDEDPPFHKRG